MSGDKLFHIVEDSFAIVRCKGVWRQTKIYHRQGKLFTAFGGGYVKLYKHGTSRPDIFVDDIITPNSTTFSSCGEIMIDISGDLDG